MDKDDYTPEQLAALARDFSETAYGEWLLGLMGRICSDYIKDAKQFTDRDAKATAIDRAAGIDEVLDVINGQLLQAAKPELFLADQNAIDNSEVTSDK